MLACAGEVRAGSTCTIGHDLVHRDMGFALTEDLRHRRCGCRGRTCSAKSRPARCAANSSPRMAARYPTKKGASAPRAHLNGSASRSAARSLP